MGKYYISEDCEKLINKILAKTLHVALALEKDNMFVELVTGTRKERRHVVAKILSMLLLEHMCKKYPTVLKLDKEVLKRKLLSHMKSRWVGAPSKKSGVYLSDIFTDFLISPRVSSADKKLIALFLKIIEKDFSPKGYS